MPIGKLPKTALHFWSLVEQPVPGTTVQLPAALLRPKRLLVFGVWGYLTLGMQGWSGIPSWGT